MANFRFSISNISNDFQFSIATQLAIGNIGN